MAEWPGASGGCGMIWRYSLGVVALVALGGRLLLTADPRRLAISLRIAGPLVLGLTGVMLTAIGRPVLGFPLVGLATVWALVTLAWPRRWASKPRHSTVRSAALEMVLDHSTGALEGLVLVGRFEGRELSELDLPSLAKLRSELRSDPDSVRLLEAYLQGRFPTWRVDADAHVGAGQTGAPGAGAMTEKEAYQILGLEPGASAADIRQAHRRLVKRLDSDLAGRSFLAARIDEARDVLLTLHG